MKFLVLLLTLVLLSCKKDDSSSSQSCEDTYVDLSTDMIPYTFKEGTYWVYENVSTGVLDSIQVLNSGSSYTGSTPSNCQIYTKLYNFSMTSFLTGNTWNYLIRGIQLRLNGSGTWGENGQLVMTNNSVGYSHEGMTIVENIANLQIGDSTFNDIRKTFIKQSEQSSPAQYDHDMYLYFAPGYGLIKWEQDLGGANEEVWELKRWNIIL